MTTSNKVAAANCRAILAQLTRDGRVNIDAFVHEMNMRSHSAYKKALTGKQVTLLRRIAEAYEREHAQQVFAVGPL